MSNVTLRVTLSTKQVNRVFKKQLDSFRWYTRDDDPVFEVFPGTYVAAHFIQHYKLQDCVLRLFFADGSRKVFDPGTFEVVWKD